MQSPNFQKLNLGDGGRIGTKQYTKSFITSMDTEIEVDMVNE